VSLSKNLANTIFEACERNPRLALLVIPFGALLVYWGNADAKFYSSLRDKPNHEMRVTEIRDVQNDRGFYVPHVFGEISTGEADFAVSPKAARSFQPGQTLQIVETNDPSRPYIQRETLDEQLSSIYFSAAGLSFNSIGILGAAMALVALAWGLFGKAKASDTPSK